MHLSMCCILIGKLDRTSSYVGVRDNLHKDSHQKLMDISTSKTFFSCSVDLYKQAGILRLFECS